MRNAQQQLIVHIEAMNGAVIRTAEVLQTIWHQNSSVVKITYSYEIHFGVPGGLDAQVTD